MDIYRVVSIKYGYLRFLMYKHFKISHLKQHQIIIHVYIRCILEKYVFIYLDCEC